ATRRSKKPVWMLFKLVELIMSLACCGVHWDCMHKGVPHIFLLCGTYGGSSIVCFLHLVGILYAEKPAMKHEAAVSGFLGTIHLVTVYTQMYMVLLDQFKTAKWNEFYECCRDNSLLAMYTASIYFLHCTFALDLMYSHSYMIKHSTRSMRPLRLYFISPGVEAYLTQFRWFQRISTRNLPSENASEQSGSRRGYVSDESETDS
ncbi:hypothetical protein KR009_007875, partial [Drosophila setifemur]